MLIEINKFLNENTLYTFANKLLLLKLLLRISFVKALAKIRTLVTNSKKKKKKYNIRLLN